MSEPVLDPFPPLRPSPPPPSGHPRPPPSSSSFPPPPPPFGPAAPPVAAVDADPAADFVSAAAVLGSIPLGDSLLVADSVTADASLPGASFLAPRSPRAAALAAAGSVVGGTVAAEHAAGSASLKEDLTQFMRNRDEISIIRAQLNTLKGKELAEYQRGSVGGGRNNKQNHFSKGNIGARQVFGKIPQPTRGHARPGAGLGRAPLPHVSLPAPPRKAWVAAVSSNLDAKKLRLVYRPPIVENGETFVEASEDSLASARNRWSDYLVGYFIEGRLPFPSVEGIAKNLWAKLGLVETFCFHKEFYFFKFADASTRARLLDHGPFLFGGRPLILQQWSPSLKLNKGSHKTIPLWAKIHHIPLAMWNSTGLGDIASAVGIPLYADNATEKLNRFDFARICVEVDASKPLLDEFSLRIDGEIVKLNVEYQWRPKRCAKCCSFGHNCEESAATAPSTVAKPPLVAAVVQQETASGTPQHQPVVAVVAPTVQKQPAPIAAPTAPPMQHQPAVASAVLVSHASKQAKATSWVSPVILSALEAVQKVPAPRPSGPCPAATSAPKAAPMAAAVQQSDDPFFRFENSFFELDDDDGFDEALDGIEDHCFDNQSTPSTQTLSPKTRGQKARHDPVIVPTKAVRQNVWTSGKKKNRGKAPLP